MAIVHPAIGNMPRPRTLGEKAERNLVDLLSARFSDNYALFHTIDWSREGGRQQNWMGELDAVLVNGNGEMVVMEVKAGELRIENGRLIHDYRDGPRNVVDQFSRQRSAMRARLNDAGLNDVRPLHLLILPDYEVHNPAASLSINPREIVDSRAYPDLVDRLRLHVPEHAVTQRGDSVKRLLMNWLDLVPDINAHKGLLGEVTRQLADGLATWVPRIQAPSRVYLINATAGCGKTQMSLDMLNQASAAGQKTLYLCYNRPLADRMRGLFSPKVTVSNYDELCADYYRRHVGEPDYKLEGIFETMQKAFQACEFDPDLSHDIIIIDEAQDFNAEWVQHLLNNRLRDNGSVYVLQDEDQRIYKRPPFELPDPVVITCDDNFRSPKNIVTFIQRLKLSDRDIRARSARSCGELESLCYTDETGLLNQTAAMIDHFLNAGYKPEDILIVTGRGKDHSLIMKSAMVGSHSLRRPTGQYDKNHEPVWTDGDITSDTIYRSKGQSAPVVILTEFDFEVLDEKATRLLFVGLTRASMGVGLVLSERAHRVIEACMRSGEI